MFPAFPTAFKIGFACSLVYKSSLMPLIYIHVCSLMLASYAWVDDDVNSICVGDHGVNFLRGHPFMTSTKNHVFHPHSPCPHASTWAGPPYPPCGRPHTIDMKYTPLS